MPNDPKGPSSPDQLQSGIHGRVEGVTRIGPRAVLLGVLIAAALLGGIIYGLTAGGSKNQQLASQSAPPIPVAPPQPTTGPHFGEDVPAVPTTGPETPPPAVLLPPSPPPLVQQTEPPSAPPEAASGPSTPSAEELAEAKRAEEEEKRREAEEAEREAELKRANLAPIFASVGGGGGGGFAGSGGGGSAGGSAPAGTYGGASAAGGAGLGGGIPGNAVAQSGGAGGAGGGGGFGGGGAAGAGGAGGAGGLGGPSGAGGGGGAAPAPTINPAYSFLSGPTGNYASTAYNIQRTNGPSHNDLQASRYAPQTVFEVLAGSVMPAILITSIDSEQPGLVTAQIRQNVYDTKSGRFLMIPAGSRLIGVYQSGVKYGQSRVEVAWQRLIFPDTSSIDLLNMSGSDAQGFAGLGGKVDNHLGTLFFGTFLTSVLTAAITLSQPQTSQVVSTSAGTVAVPSQGQVAAQGVGQNLTSTAQQLVQRDLNLPPVVYIPKGYPFLVVVDKDMVFPGPYGPYVDPGL